MLEFELRLLRLPIILLNDFDIQLLHEKGIKRRLLVYPSDWNSRGMCLVLVWEIIEANRYENLVIFLEISVAIDLHEGSGPINHEIIANSISLAQSHLRIYILWDFYSTLTILEVTNLHFQSATSFYTRQHAAQMVCIGIHRYLEPFLSTLSKSNLDLDPPHYRTMGQYS